MSRVPVTVWAWRCDWCGYQDNVIARTYSKMPTVKEMEAAGWRFSEYGDQCPCCVGKLPDRENWLWSPDT